MNANNNSIAYNNFLHMPEVPYKIIERLATSTSQSAENLWKILKHATTDALSKPNLTFEEKIALLWTPDVVNATQQNLFTVFLKPLVSSSLDTAEEQIQLRIYKIINKPRNNIESSMGYQFDMYTSEVCCMVYNEDGYLCERTDLMEAYILDILNGADIGIGKIQFYSQDLSSISKSSLTINNGKSLYGRNMILSLIYINAQTGGVCGG